MLRGRGRGEKGERENGGFTVSERDKSRERVKMTNGMGVVAEKKLEKQIEKQMGCMAGFLHIFDRHQIFAGKRIYSVKRLPPSTPPVLIIHIILSISLSLTLSFNHFVCVFALGSTFVAGTGHTRWLHGGFDAGNGNRNGNTCSTTREDASSTSGFRFQGRH